MERRASPPGQCDACGKPGGDARHSTNLPDRRCPSPYPGIVQRIANQSGPYGILQHVIELLLNVLFFSQRAVKRFLLPDSPSAIQKFVDAVRRSALDSLHDLRHGHRPLGVTNWHESQMNVIRHDDQAVEVKFQTISSHTGIDNNCSCIERKGPAEVSTESDEYYLEVWLEMRQTASIFIRVHIGRISTAP